MDPTKVIYVVATPQHHERHLYKVGRWSSSQGALRSRYDTHSPDRFLIFLSCPTPTPESDEKDILGLLDSYRYKGEWVEMPLHDLTWIISNYYRKKTLNHPPQTSLNLKDPFGEQRSLTTDLRLFFSVADIVLTRKAPYQGYICITDPSTDSYGNSLYENVLWMSFSCDLDTLKQRLMSRLNIEELRRYEALNLCKGNRPTDIATVTEHIKTIQPTLYQCLMDRIKEEDKCIVRKGVKIRLYPRQLLQEHIYKVLEIYYQRCNTIENGLRYIRGNDIRVIEEKRLHDLLEQRGYTDDVWDLHIAYCVYDCLDLKTAAGTMVDSCIERVLTEKYDPNFTGYKLQYHEAVTCYPGAKPQIINFRDKTYRDVGVTDRVVRNPTMFRIRLKREISVQQAQNFLSLWIPDLPKFYRFCRCLLVKHEPGAAVLKINYNSKTRYFLRKFLSTLFQIRITSGLTHNVSTEAFLRDDLSDYFKYRLICIHASSAKATQEIVTKASRLVRQNPTSILVEEAVDPDIVIDTQWLKSKFDYKRDITLGADYVEPITRVITSNM